MKTELFGLFLDEIVEILANLKVPAYRARQIAEWMYRRGVTEFSQMTNLSKELRQLLAGTCRISALEAIAEQHSQDRKTSKYLLRLADGNAVETVLMRQSYGNSVCVSSQVGCAMGCTFCASTLNGVVRNLTAAEILGQVFHFQRLLAGSSAVNTIVMMGSGEPLLNYDQVIRFLHLCHAEYCLHTSYRNITISTSGIVPGIEKLSKEGLPVNLSISLHAPNNDLRSELMPVNQKYPIETVLGAADGYARVTGRRVTYEYTLIEGLNDSIACARELAHRIKGQLANVNLIPVNAVPEKGLMRPTTKAVSAFAEELKKLRVNVTIRKEMGADIQAACGQLRHKSLSKTKETADNG